MSLSISVSSVVGIAYCVYTFTQYAIKNPSSNPGREAMLTWFHPSLTRFARPRGACNGAYRCRILTLMGFPRHGSQVVFAGFGVVAALSFAVYSLATTFPVSC